MNWEPISLSPNGTLSPLTIRGGEIMSSSVCQIYQLSSYDFNDSFICIFITSDCLPYFLTVSRILASNPWKLLISPM